ncbi:acetylxylan esterase [Galbibacter sp. EGI 63066]|uniref:glucuronyl esterase domain-containing protein n=1 Tax=Galbibacter sp. EGI 63066 TaxID=2993559 RepID=UPI0022491A2B|nr:acetylxylan esterase [Galbibacter sp. EGI 63066]MCX2681827.1 acetylxylan esterase [Galbibacter sp. EGI 63066]
MKTTTLFIGLLAVVNCYGQFNQAYWDSINKLNREDHQHMMKQLGITEMRPGPSGDPEAPNAANTDESKAKQYDSLPNPLVFNDGTFVKTPDDWENRRAELFELFDREVYGRLPENLPEVTWEVVSEKDTVEGEASMKLRELVGRVDNSAYPDIEVNIQVVLGIPLNIETPIPAVMEFGWDWRKFKGFGPQPDGPSWREQLLKKGWGFAIIIPNSFQADNGAGLTQGIIGLTNKGQRRKPDNWGTLRAWAWGAGKLMDYFKTNLEIDETKVAIEGLSRYGKAAIVTMAYDSRFAVGFIGSSGAGGTKILRHIFGEQVENLASSAEYHWFAGNFIKYASALTVNDLPVDAHELVALCAPRPVFISSGSAAVEGQWVDAKGMFLAVLMQVRCMNYWVKKDFRLQNSRHRKPTCQTVISPLDNMRADIPPGLTGLIL